jgi:hypothetical protein
MEARIELMNLAIKFQEVARHAKSQQLEAEQKEEAGELTEGYGEYWKGTRNAYSNASQDLQYLIEKLDRIFSY